MKLYEIRENYNKNELYIVITDTNDNQYVKSCEQEELYQDWIDVLYGDIDWEEFLPFEGRNSNEY